MPKLHHPELMRIRNKYHAVRSNKPVWAKIKALVATDAPAKIAAAEALAKATINGSPNLRVRHVAARASRAQKIAFLRAQQAEERAIKATMQDLGDRLAGLVSRAAGPDGKLMPRKMRGVFEQIKARNREAYKEVNATFAALLKTGAKMGLKGAMSVAAQAVAELKKHRARAKESGYPDFTQGLPCPPNQPNLTHLTLPTDLAPLAEGGDEEAGLEEADPGRQKVEYGTNSAVFQKIFKGALKQTMEAGLFGDTGVSNRVWDLRDQNYLALKRLVSAGLQRGDSASEIAADLQNLLLDPEGMTGAAFAGAAPGPGVYRSAYRNALRLTRTESNRAFGASNALFAAEKGWNVIWHVSDGQREEDECDDLDGQEMTPEEYADQYPKHPQCLCYSTLAVPEDADLEEPTPDDAPEDVGGSD